MTRPLKWYDTITVSAYFLGLSTISATMTPLLVPLLVQQFVGIGNQGSYYGMIRLWSLMTALLVQSLMGLVSDNSTFRIGRRRPFIFLGTIAGIFFIIAIGLSTNMHGNGGYWFLFTMMILLMVSINTSQAAAQGLIPDIVPTFAVP